MSNKLREQSDALSGLRSEDEIIRLSFESAFAIVASGESPAPATAEAVHEGAHFKIPLVIPEGVTSGDGRTFTEGALSLRELPIPLLWQIETQDGHDASVIVGRIDSAERIDGGIGNAYGVFDTGPYGREAQRLVEQKFLRGVSADLDEFEARADAPAENSGQIKSSTMTITKGRVMAATLVAKPAFQECSIEIVGDSEVGAPIVEDGVYESPAIDDTSVEQTLAALAASAAPDNPPIHWFSNPQLNVPTPLTITDDGHVYGHIAAWHVDHIGLPFGTKPPKSKSDYAYFKTGVCRTSEGVDVPVGQLTLAGGHAPLRATAAAAVKHYDDTASAVADVTAGEDMHGIWVAGALRPGVTPSEIRALRASAPSGDWRPIRGRLELVAVCQVNVPGFPVTRTLVAGGQIQALVAAGVAPLVELRQHPLDELSMRVAALENERLRERYLTVSSRLAPARQARAQELSARHAAARARFAPELDSRAAALSARAEEARARFAGLRVPPPFVESQHPRANDGKFKSILARLEVDLKGKDDGGGLSSLKDAAAAEKNGDHKKANQSAKDAAAKFKSAAAKATGPDAGKLDEAAKQLELEANAKTSGPAGEHSVPFDQLPDDLKSLLNSILNDPSVDESEKQQLRKYSSGNAPVVPSEIAKLIANLLRRLALPGA